MREGPLADLFRSTEEDSQRRIEQPPAEAEAAPGAPAAPPSGAARRLEAVADEPAEQAAYRPRGDTSSYLATIRVVGVGGAGLNAVSRMIEARIDGVEFVALNTDAQQLAMSDAQVKIQLGRELTRGLGAGADSDVGRRAAEAGTDRLRQVLRGSDLVFVAAGEGGGTGTGAAPVIARIARELGALTVGIVTLPFRFEGPQRRQVADAGMARLAAEVDTLIVVPNDRLLDVLDRSTPMVDAFRVADDVLRQGVQGICDLITRPGLINLDFADVRTIMKDSGNALMGIGMATGADRGANAARRAIESPLMDDGVRGATGVILSIAGGPDLSLHEITEAADVVRGAASDDANVIFGTSVDPELEGQLWVTVIATGFERSEGGQRPPERRAADWGSSGDVDVPPFLFDS